MSCTSRLLWATLPFVFVMPGVTPALAQSDQQMTVGHAAADPGLRQRVVRTGDLRQSAAQSARPVSFAPGGLRQGFPCSAEAA